MDDAKPKRDDTKVAARRRWCEMALMVAAACVAAVSARDYAGGWNDGSRLATVESLVDRHSLAIDESIFVRSHATLHTSNPYLPGDELLRTKGTQDKLLIAGHYYSDKSPLPALGLAACYQLLQWASGITAHERPRLFCYLMTLGSSGVAYVITVWSVWRLSLRKGLPRSTCLLLSASLALATVTLPYVRHVNNHILLLSVVSLLMLTLDRLAFIAAAGAESLLLASLAGALAGLGYTFDLGLGPVLLLSTALVVAYRASSVAAMACFGLAALPWLIAHHAVNYCIGGTIAPANSVAEYLAWPGSPFSPKNMTGGWAHRDVGHFGLYAAALLFGKHGFLNYNLPLFAAIAAPAVFFRRRPAEVPELIFAAVFSAATWLLYAGLSNNYSGPCCSIRWFVPLLAPGYYTLVVLLRERPELIHSFTFLNACGVALAAWLWWQGPWEGAVPVLLWPLNIAALLLLIFGRNASPSHVLAPDESIRRQAA